MAEVRPLLRFSKWRFGSNLLYYVSTRADDLLVGRYLGRTSLGSYRIAYRLANLPTTEIVSVLESVAFPALAARARESRGLGDHDLSPLPHVDVRAGRAARRGVRRAGPAHRRRPARPGVRRRPRCRWRSCASPATCGR